MPQIQVPTFDDYASFAGSVYYKKALAGEGVEYVFFDMTPGNTDPDSALAPITRGEGIDINVQIDVYEVNEWGKRVIEEFADGKFKISGSINTFYIPEQEDLLPDSQDFMGRRFLLLQRVAEGYAGAGIALKAWENVVLNSKDLSSQTGLIRRNIRFLASRE